MNQRTNIDASVLRKQFDQAFLLPQDIAVARNERFVCVEVAGIRLALRVENLSGFIALPKVAPLPVPDSALLGIVGNRGKLLPVYRLATILGMAEADSERWLIMCEEPEPVGFAVPKLEGYMEIPCSDIHAAAPGKKRKFTSAVALVNGVPFDIVDVSSLLDAFGKKEQ